MSTLKIKFSICVLLNMIAPSILAATANSVSAPLPVYLLLGQSNMLGVRSSPEQLPENLKQTQENALFFHDNKWVPLAPGVSEKKGFGPEISFASKLPSNRKFGIIKLSAGDTNLAVDWSQKEKGKLYSRTIGLVNSAKATRPIKIKAVLWMQGESDAMDEKMAQSYSSNLKDFIKKLRHDLNDSSIAFSVCRETAPVDQFPYTNTVRLAQKDLQKSISAYEWFDCDGLSKGSDNLHYDTVGQINLGDLFAKSIVSLGAQPN